MRLDKRLKCCGDDQLFIRHAIANGCHAGNFVAKQFMLGDQVVTAVGIINRKWFDPMAMERLTSAIAQFQAFARTFVILPERALLGLSGENCHSAPSIVTRWVDDAARPLAEHPTFDNLACHPRTRHDPRGCRAVMTATGRPCLG